MARMLRGRWIALLIALCSLLLASSAGGRVGDGDPSPAQTYWLGPYFAGMAVSGTLGSSFVYGRCELPEGEGGCAPPAQVQNASSCARNPIGLDRIPQEVFLLRGGALATVNESTGVDIGTGTQTVTVYTSEPELTGAALREFHTRAQSGPEPLAPPVYPLPVLRELKRVTAVAGRLGGIGAISRATDLPPAEVELRLRIAELLGPEALAGVPAPTMSTDTVERLRQLAFRSQFHPARAAMRLGISVASLRTKLRRVRGLTGNC
jgi:hypothetical protein